MLNPDHEKAPKPSPVVNGVSSDVKAEAEEETKDVDAESVDSKDATSEEAVAGESSSIEVEKGKEKPLDSIVNLELDGTTDDDAGDGDDYDSEEEFLEKRREKSTQWRRQATRYAWVLEDRLKFLEKKIADLTGADPKRKAKESEVKAASETKVQVESKIQVMTWQEYCVNKGRDKAEDAATIDVLIEEALPFNPHGRVARSSIERATPHSEEELISKAKALNRLPERIRINSRPLQELLREIARSDDIPTASDTSTLVCVKPFKMFYTLETPLRIFLADAEKALSDLKGAEPSKDIPKNSEKSKEGDVVEEEAIVEGDPEKLHAESEKLLELSVEVDDIRCLIQVIDIFLKPIQLCLAPESLPETVRFEELWLLFRPGCLVIVVDERDVTQKIWKVVQKRGGRRYLRPRERADDDDYSNDMSGDYGDNALFTLDCYYIDYNGDRLGAVMKRFTLSSFDGRRPIKSLNIYPLANAHADFIGTKKELMELGEKFLECTKVQHRSYSGMTLSRQPSGLAIGQGRNERAELASDVESTVVIDFSLTFQNQDSWAPEFATGQFSQDNAREYEEVPSNYDRVKSRDERDWLRPDIITRDYEWDQRARLGVLVSLEADRKRWEKGEKLTGDELLLLPDRVFGYVLKSRSWAPFKLSLLREIEADMDGLQDLQLPDGYREVIQSLIEWQFSRGKNGTKHHHAPDFDVVKNKGRGLVVLLHGAPGLGKTSTAECIAHANSKPLLSITCGALGETASLVEFGLQRLFRLAQAWDCVLLLDEADVFLAERTLQDMKRNGIVSVFLRTLEYYEGILFLTTNRVGELDEAFRSRIHMALFYPPLNRDRTYKVWEMQLRRLYERVPDLVCNKNDVLNYGMYLFKVQNEKKADTNWNGRQIRNAFQSAMALARFRSTRLPGVAPELLVKDFQEVTKAADEFDDYLYRTRGRYEPDRAKFNQLRAAEKAHAQHTNSGGYNQTYYPSTPEFRPHAPVTETYEDFVRSQQPSYRSPQPIPSQVSSSVTSFGSPSMGNARYQSQQQAAQQTLSGYVSAPIQGQTYIQQQFQPAMTNGVSGAPPTMQSTLTHQRQESQGFYQPQPQSLPQQQQAIQQQYSQGGLVDGQLQRQQGFDIQNQMGQSSQLGQMGQMNQQQQQQHQDGMMLPMGQNQLSMVQNQMGISQNQNGIVGGMGGVHISRQLNVDQGQGQQGHTYQIESVVHG